MEAICVVKKNSVFRTNHVKEVAIMLIFVWLHLDELWMDDPLPRIFRRVSKTTTN